MSVNLSGRQLADPCLVDQIDQVLAETALTPSALHLEVTESVAMEDAEAAILVLDRMKRRGIRLGIDDFGTGYSSLSHLHRFPLDTLKIDRSFVGRMESDAGNSRIVPTIVSLARSLGMEVVAEGIETEGQLAPFCPGLPLWPGIPVLQTAHGCHGGDARRSGSGRSANESRSRERRHRERSLYRNAPGSSRAGV